MPKKNIANLTRVQTGSLLRMPSLRALTSSKRTKFKADTSGFTMLSNACVGDIKSAVSAIEPRHTFAFRNTGKGNVARAHRKYGGYHTQGVARLNRRIKAQWLAYTTTKGVVLVMMSRLKGQSGAWSNESPSKDWDQGDAVVTIKPHVARHDHVGGIQAVGRFLLVGSNGGGSAGIGVYDCANPARPTLVRYIEIKKWISDAHYVGAIRLQDGRYLVFAARDQRERLQDKTHRVAFFITAGKSLASADWRYLGSWNRGGKKDYQSASLVAQRNGQIFFVGLGKGNVRRTKGDVDVWRLDSIVREKVSMTLVKRKEVGTRRRNCNFDAGASVYVAPDGHLVVYCIQKKEQWRPRRRGKLHFQEFTRP